MFHVTFITRWRFKEEDTDPTVMFLPRHRQQRLDEPTRLALGASHIPRSTSENAYATRTAKGLLRKRTAAEASKRLRREDERDIADEETEHRRLLDMEEERQQVRRDREEAARLERWQRAWDTGCSADEYGEACTSALPSPQPLMSAAPEDVAYFEKRKRARHEEAEVDIAEIRAECLLDRRHRYRQQLHARQQRHARRQRHSSKRNPPRPSTSSNTPRRKSSPRAKPVYKMSREELHLKALESRRRWEEQQDDFLISSIMTEGERELEEDLQRHARDERQKMETDLRARLVQHAEEKRRKLQQRIDDLREHRDRLRLEMFEKERARLLEKLADK
jgi:hypothetical protein